MFQHSTRQLLRRVHEIHHEGNMPRHPELDGVLVGPRHEEQEQYSQHVNPTHHRVVGSRDAISITSTMSSMSSSRIEPAHHLQIHAGACCADEALPGQANCVPGAGKNSEDDELRNVWPVILPQGWQVATPNISVAQIILPRRHVWSPRHHLGLGKASDISHLPDHATLAGRISAIRGVGLVQLSPKPEDYVVQLPKVQRQAEEGDPERDRQSKRETDEKLRVRAVKRNGLLQELFNLFGQARFLIRGAV
mmetsp:Transcript_22470/g.53514  ORF Transcript_22470/g.53514 Transcript_22470/m.53514 type:complete len:250 (-) Transcript_22470:96-845(-)